MEWDGHLLVCIIVCFIGCKLLDKLCDVIWHNSELLRRIIKSIKDRIKHG